jgi:uncharacterized protein (DUF4415 family)
MNQAITAAHHQRIIDTAAGTYPHPDRPKNCKGKSDEWIAAYQDTYLNPKKKGKPPIGQTAKMQISTRVDPEVMETAKRLGVNISVACQEGLEAAIEKLVLKS